MGLIRQTPQGSVRENRYNQVILMGRTKARGDDDDDDDETGYRSSADSWKPHSGQSDSATSLTVIIHRMQTVAVILPVGTRLHSKQLLHGLTSSFHTTVSRHCSRPTGGNQ